MLVREYYSITHISSLIDPKEGGHFVSDTDLDYISKFKTIKRQTSSIAVRSLARKLLAHKTGIAGNLWEFQILENKNRMAVSSEGVRLHISFSHSPSWAAVAISDTPIGIDIEEIKLGRPWQEMLGFLELSENTPVPATQLEFLRRWTAHEASIKFRSADPSEFHLHTFDVSLNSIACIATSCERAEGPELVAF